MKFGCCLNMLVTPEQAKTPLGATGIENLELLGTCGYDYAELPLAEMLRLDTQQQRELLHRVRTGGVPCEACNNFFPPQLRLTGPDVDREKVRTYGRIALAFAAELGAKRIVFGSGKAKQVPDGFSMDEAFRQLAELLAWAGEQAKTYGITLVIEPLRKAECNIIHTFEEGVRLAEAVQNENVRVLADYYHLCAERESLQHLLNGARWLAHVHLAYPEGRRFPTPADGADLEAFFKTLRQICYQQRISCEAYSSAPEQDLEKSIRLLRTVFSSGRA